MIGLYQLTGIKVSMMVILLYLMFNVSPTKRTCRIGNRGLLHYAFYHSCFGFLSRVFYFFSRFHSRLLVFKTREKRGKNARKLNFLCISHYTLGKKCELVAFGSRVLEPLRLPKHKPKRIV